MKPFISFCLLLCICLGKLYAQGVNIVYIGNSITQGALLKTPVTEAPPVQASQYIEQATKQSVAFRNCGVSGTTTLDFLPIAKRQFPNVKSAAQELSQRKGTLLFSIMLGTNDSACNGPFDWLMNHHFAFRIQRKEFVDNRFHVGIVLSLIHI